jgi:hypothetical protein
VRMREVAQCCISRSNKFTRAENRLPATVTAGGENVKVNEKVRMTIVKRTRLSLR